jgi:hypothetical protein
MHDQAWFIPWPIANIDHQYWQWIRGQIMPGIFHTLLGVHLLVKVKFKNFFFSKFKDLELGKFFENVTDLQSIIHFIQ